jgi:hypothetical protein
MAPPSRLAGDFVLRANQMAQRVISNGTENAL